MMEVVVSCYCEEEEGGEESEPSMSYLYERDCSNNNSSSKQAVVRGEGQQSETSKQAGRTDGLAGRQADRPCNFECEGGRRLSGERGRRPIFVLDLMYRLCR